MNSHIRNGYLALRTSPALMQASPVLLLISAVDALVERGRESRRDPERGAISVETALVTLGLMAVAALVLWGIYTFATTEQGKISGGTASIPTDPAGK